MAYLLTGGTGKTSLHAAWHLELKSRWTPFLLASRHTESSDKVWPYNHITFDYTDPSTYNNPFSYRFPRPSDKITAVYLVAPDVPDPVPYMNAFIDVAIKNRVERFVLLGGIFIKKGGDHVGGVWQYLDDLGVDYTVLRPSWFMDNLQRLPHSQTIREEDKIYSAMGDGKAPFVAASDVGRYAYEMLTSKTALEHEYTIGGPEMLDYDEIAARLSKYLKREIKHVKLSAEDKIKKDVQMGLPESYSQFITRLEVMTANGEMEEAETDSIMWNFDKWAQNSVDKHLLSTH